MWIIKALVVFLIVWAAWYVCWTVIFGALHIGRGPASLPVTIGAVVALLLTGKILERRRQKK
jgi:hypothetical protein